AAVVHLEHFLVGADDEVVVDADLAELVDDDGELLPVWFGQDAVQEGGLAGAQIAGEHGDGNLVGHERIASDTERRINGRKGRRGPSPLAGPLYRAVAGRCEGGAEAAAASWPTGQRWRPPLWRVCCPARGLRAARGRNRERRCEPECARYCFWR